jgi:hypothetical protein
MSDDMNILTPIVDAIWNYCKWTYDVWFGDDSFNFDNFFDSVALKNKLDEKPKLLDNRKQENKNSYIFSIPDGLSLNDFAKYKEAMEQQLNNKVNIKYENKRIIVEEITSKLKNNYPYILPSKEDKEAFRIPVGASIYGTEYIYPNEIPHTLISGTTGSGKSVCTKSLLTSILNMFNEDEADVVLIDFKLVELNLFKNCKQVTKYVYETEEAVEVVADLLEECKRRYKLFQDANVTNLKEYNKKYPNKKLKHQFIFIEEFVMFSEEKVGMKMLRKLASLSRASSQFIFLSCQRPDNTVIDNVFKANVGNRLCFRTEDSKNSIVILDREGAEKLKGNGNGIYKTGAKDIEMQGYFIRDSDIKKYIKKYETIKRAEAPEEVIAETNISNINKYKKAPDKKDIPRAKTNINSNTIYDLSFLDRL